MLSGEEDARRVLDHVVLLARVAGDDGRGQDVVVVARGARRDEGVGPLRPGVRPPPRHHRLARHRHRVVAEDALEVGISLINLITTKNFGLSHATYG